MNEDFTRNEIQEIKNCETRLIHLHKKREEITIDAKKKCCKEKNIEFRIKKINVEIDKELENIKNNIRKLAINNTSRFPDYDYWLNKLNNNWHINIIICIINALIDGADELRYCESFVRRISWIPLSPFEPLNNNVNKIFNKIFFKIIFPPEMYFYYGVTNGEGRDVITGNITRMS
jgi:hypothetical protein